MTIIKFKASSIGPSIERIEVISETDHFVSLASNYGGKPNREKKITDWYGFFDSFEDAKKFLMDEADQRVRNARRQLELANSRLGNVKGIKEAKNV